MNNRRGAILPLIAVTLVGFMALLALAIDGGSLQRHRRLAQNAADAGALAGAMEIIRSHSDSSIFATALEQAGRNGFTNGVNGVHVAATHPTSPDYFTGPTYVKVVVVDTVPTLFAGIIGRSSAVVVARAWGGIIAPSGACLISLDPLAPHAIEIKDNGTTVDATNCGVRVNSTSVTAFANNANSTIDVTGGSIGVTGGPPTVPNGVTGPYTTGVVPLADPLGYLTMPSFDHTCDYTPNGAGGTLNSTVAGNTTVVTLNPGTYCGGISVKSGGTAILTEGVYFLLGGGLGVQSAARISSTGAGVTFVNTWDASHDYKRINLQSAATIILNANTDAANTLHGILFYQDRSVTGSAGLLAGNANNFQSGSGSVLSGTIYFPTQDVEFHSGSTMSLIGGVIARRVSIHSGTELTFTPSGGGGSGYFAGKRASVVE